MTSYLMITDASIFRVQAAKLKKNTAQLEDFPELSELETAEPLWAPYSAEEGAEVTWDNKLAEVKRRYRPPKGSQQHYTRVQTGKPNMSP